MHTVKPGMGAVAVVLALCARAAATDYVAVASGSWTNPATWSPSSGFPGAGDSARNAGRNVTLHADVSGLSMLWAAGWGGGKLDLNGYNLSASTIHLGSYNRGAITGAGDIVVSGQMGVWEGGSVTLDEGDRISQLYVGFWSGTPQTDVRILDGSVISDRLEVSGAGELNLYKNLTVPGSVFIGGNGGTLKMNGFSVTTPYLSFQTWGWGTSDGTGRIYVNGVNVAEGGDGRVAGGVVSGSVNVSAPGEYLRVIQAARQVDGLTFDGSSLTLNGVLDLQFDGARVSGLDWAFRWKGDHTNAVRGLVQAAKVRWSAPFFMRITNWYDQASAYTYIGDPHVPGEGMVITVR